MLTNNIFLFSWIVKSYTIIYRNLLKSTTSIQRPLISTHQHQNIFGKHHIHKKQGIKKGNYTYPSQNGGKYWLCSKRRLYNKPSTKPPISSQVCKNRIDRTHRKIIDIYFMDSNTLYQDKQLHLTYFYFSGFHRSSQIN